MGSNPTPSAAAGRDGTQRWARDRRFGRLQVGVTVYKHSYGGFCSDRWVIQPSIVYDRKEAR